MRPYVCSLLFVYLEVVCLALTLTGRVAVVRASKPSADGKYGAAVNIQLLDWGQRETLFVPESNAFYPAVAALKLNQDIGIPVEVSAITDRSSGNPRLRYTVVGQPVNAPAK